MFLHAQCRSFFGLLMFSADSYIDVRERLQVNDFFMHMLVDICANNCKSRKCNFREFQVGFKMYVIFGKCTVHASHESKYTPVWVPLVLLFHIHII